MPKKKYEVLLKPEDESVLKSMTHTGSKCSAREILHAQVLLHSNDNRPESKKNNRELAEWLDISPTTVNQVRKTYAESGLEACLNGCRHHIIMRGCRYTASPLTSPGSVVCQRPAR